MRKQATKNRSEEREKQRVARREKRAERIRAGEAALAKGADWAELATIFGIKTAEGAAQWWRRNHDGLQGWQEVQEEQEALSATARGGLGTAKMPRPPRDSDDLDHVLGQVSDARRA